MSDGKIGICDRCENEQRPLTYSNTYAEWMCEYCYEYTADLFFGSIEDE